MSVLRDYTRKDITEIRSYLVSKVNEICDKYSVDWTDRNESDLGMLFIELISGVADMLNFNIDKQALECYIGTATQRKNVKGILDLINYEMSPPTSAMTNGIFTLSQALDIDITIPKYFQVSYPRSEGNIYYATKQDCQILKGELSVNVPLIQGIVNTINLTVSDIVSRTIVINSTKVAKDSVIFTVGDTEWTKVDDVLVDEIRGTKYSVHENNLDQAYVELGYDYNEFLPIDKSTKVTIQYLDTEGSSGSVKSNTITEIDDNLVIDNTDYTDYLTVNNTDLASGGSDRESIETARIKAPNTVVTRGLMTTLSDYESIASNFNGVYKVKAVDWNIDNGKYVSVPYQVKLYVLTNDKDTYECSSTYLNELKSYLDKYRWSPIKLQLYSPVIKDIDIDVKVYTIYSKSNHIKIKRDIEDSLINYFNKTNRNFGETITIGTLDNIVKSSNSMISYCEIIIPKETMKLSTIEFPRLNELNISVLEE